MWLAVAAYATGFTALSVLRDDAFTTGRFDLGNMVQAVWSTAHGHPLRITDLRGDQISRLAAHADPLIAVFAPLWWVWPSAHMLLAGQALAVALGSVPVFWLARKHLGSARTGLGFALAYLFYPATQWLTLNEFHPVALACPLLLCAIWYLDENRLLLFAAFALAASLSKEEIPLVVAGLGIWYAVSKRRWLAGAAIAGVGVAVSALAIGVVIPHFNHGAGSSFYARYGEVGGSPRGIAHTALVHPGRIVTTALGHAGSHYLLELVAPLAGLCLLAPLVLVALLPELAINLLSATPTQTSIRFHYTAGEIPVLIAASILGAAWLVRRVPRLAASIGALAVSAALVGNYVLGALPVWQRFPHGQSYASHDVRVTRHDRVAEAALRIVPGRAVVSATNSLGAHLSARRRVLSFPFVQDATWVAVDETHPSFADRVAPLPSEVEVLRLRRSPAWRLVFERDGVLVFRRVLPA